MAIPWKPMVDPYDGLISLNGDKTPHEIQGRPGCFEGSVSVWLERHAEGKNTQEWPDEERKIRS